MNLLRQIWIISILNLRNLPARAWQSLVIVLGMALVIAVLLSMLSMTEGLYQSALRIGAPDLALVVSKGARDEGQSAIPRQAAQIIMDVRGIARASDNSPMADAQLLVQVPALLKTNGGKNSILLRGLGPKGLMLRPELRLVAGRIYHPGTHELIVGVSAQTRFQNIAIGDKVILPDGEWSIVGSFTTGNLEEGMLIGDVETVMQALRHQAFNSVLARMASAGSFPSFQHAITTNPALRVETMIERDWYIAGAADFFTLFDLIIYGVGVLLAVGALFGCFNTMYSAVDTRLNEIATLRALGFGGLAVAASVILEAALLSVAGVLIGAGFVWLRYDGVETGFQANAFKLVVSPHMIAIALLWAVAVALLGGMLPAIRAGRMSVVEALRAT